MNHVNKPTLSPSQADGGRRLALWSTAGAVGGVFYFVTTGRVSGVGDVAICAVIGAVAFGLAFLVGGLLRPLWAQGFVGGLVGGTALVLLTHALLAPVAALRRETISVAVGAAVAGMLWRLFAPRVARVVARF